MTGSRRALLFGTRLTWILTLSLGGILLLACAGCLVPFDLLGHLLAGWALFLWRVVPRMTVSLAGVGTAMVCLVVLVPGLQGFLAWLYARHGAVKSNPADVPRQWRFRWTANVLALVVLMFVAGMAVTGVAHQTAWLATTREPLIKSGGFREAVERVKSTYNLKEIFRAAEAYYEVRGGFPPGGTFDARGRMLHGWQARLLPYLDQKELHTQIAFELPWDHPRNAPAFRVKVQAFLYPSDHVPAEVGGFAATHYAGNVHVLGGDVGRTLRNITDGTSNTILAGEAAGNFKPWGYPANWRDPGRGLNRSPDGFGAPVSRTHRVVNLLMADGSVRPLSDDTAPAVLKALATPDAGDDAPPP